MLKTLIIADDSTGANASAILLNRLQYNTLSLIDYEHASLIIGYDAIAISTDSRGIDQDNAYKRTYHVLNQVKKDTIKILNKRIDSTLRGNLGAELNAFKEVYPDHLIAIVPSFPSSGRTCKNGDIYVYDTLLENTDVAKDPKYPINTSNAQALFEKQFTGSIKHISLDEIKQANLIDLIKDYYKHYDALLFDAATNKDIERISETLMKLDKAYITVDPGPFTYEMTKAYNNKTANKRLTRYIYLVGSVTDVTFNQIKTASNQDDFLTIPVSAYDILNGTVDDVQILNSISNSNKEFILITTIDPQNRQIINLFDYAKKNALTVDDISKLINTKLSLLLQKVLDSNQNVGGIFTSGGDVTLSFLHDTKAQGIHLIKQVIPLCVYGKIVGGKYDDLTIITKGGMIGDESTYLTIQSFFKERENNE